MREILPTAVRGVFWCVGGGGGGVGGGGGGGRGTGREMTMKIQHSQFERFQPIP